VIEVLEMMEDRNSGTKQIIKIKIAKRLKYNKLLKIYQSNKNYHL
jgi:hypothetical protein